MLVAAIVLVAPAAFANQPDNCPALGYVAVGPAPPYEYTANGVPSYDLCWSKTNVTFMTGTHDYCNYYRNFWEFSNGGVLYQTMTVPSNLHGSSVRLFYILDAIDPHSDGNANAIRADIYDVTTGNTWLGGDFWSGFSGSLYCTQRISYGFASGDLAGHTLQVIFSARKGSDDVHITVKFVSLQ
ncbi:MAG TPA: hypothetical protein VF713_21005 [Thermoanaerobaculia bacterium]